MKLKYKPGVLSLSIGHTQVNQMETGASAFYVVSIPREVGDILQFRSEYENEVDFINWDSLQYVGVSKCTKCIDNQHAFRFLASRLHT